MSIANSAKQTHSWKSTHGGVYVIGSRNARLVKVGMSNNIDSRVRQIQARLNFDCESLTHIYCSDHLEAVIAECAMQFLLRDKHIYKEWFGYDDNFPYGDFDDVGFLIDAYLSDRHHLNYQVERIARRLMKRNRWMSYIDAIWHASRANSLLRKIGKKPSPYLVEYLEDMGCV